MDEIRQILSSMRAENNSNFSSIDLKLSNINTELKDIKAEVRDLSLSVDSLDKDVMLIRDNKIPELKLELKKEIEQLKTQRLSAELYSKKTNLLFYGIKQQPDENCEKTIREFISKNLGLDAEAMLLANVHRLPSRKVSSRDRPRPIITKFVLMKDRDAVLRAAPSLRHFKENYGISPHLPFEMQAIRQKLLPIRRSAISSGKTAFIKTSGTDVLLFIDNKLYKQD